MHLNSKSKSDNDDGEDDSDGLVLSGKCVLPCVKDDESHYITTHEIQLYELSDNEADYDIGVIPSCWDIDDDNHVYSFVDNASLDNTETTKERGAREKIYQCQSNNGAAVSSLVGRDMCDWAKSTSTDESLSAIHKSHGNSAGQIHLSIRTSSRSINEPSNNREQDKIPVHAKHARNICHYIFRGPRAKAGKPSDSKSFVAYPGRLHFGRKLKGKHVKDYSSCASSVVSDLDDADKEVRNLTARAFKSLAYPCFDTINFSTSSQSSTSEHGLRVNRWSTSVELKCGNMSMSQEHETNVVPNKNTNLFYEMPEDKRDYMEYRIPLDSMNPSPGKIFTLNGNPRHASSSTKKIELTGRFGQAHSGVITLTEKLNLRCDFKTKMSEVGRRSNSAQSAAGSDSTDEVTYPLPSGQGCGAIKPPSRPNIGQTMDDTHKKAVIASSLLKNVISKKMQFEQERRMERGEICEPYQSSSPFCLHKEIRGEKNTTPRNSQKSQHGQTNFLEPNTDFIICVEELGDIEDSNSCEVRSESRQQGTLPPKPETNLESTTGNLFEAKKGALPAAKSSLLPSQNSAFRTWRDGELEFLQEHESDKTREGNPPSLNDKQGKTDMYTYSGKRELTEMSHLFVPSSIHVLSSYGKAATQLPTMEYSVHTPADQEESGMKLRTGDTLYVADLTRSITAKSPEMKINMRSVRVNTTNRCNSPAYQPKISNIGCKAANLTTRDALRYQAPATTLKGESSDKIPQFMVRDIRDTKGKLQTSIHQVRDVRKLVKSSYHFVSLDNNENKLSSAAELYSEQNNWKQRPNRNSSLISPIVIKCQSVNTNSNVNLAGNVMDVSKHRIEDTFEIERSSPEGAKKSISHLQRLTGRVGGKIGDSSEGAVMKIETETASRKKEETPDKIDKKPESKLANLAALEKLQAAIKTMEQLYVFDRNEWKRRSESQPMSDEHVLSVIAPDKKDQGKATIEG
ncbi:uncharacterized protein C4orf54 homolog [Aplochiton taeniatus]